MDHNSYPQVSGGKALVDVLQAGKYIKNRPADDSVFIYHAINNGQDFELTLKDKKDKKVVETALAEK